MELFSFSGKSSSESGISRRRPFDDRSSTARDDSPSPGRPRNGSTTTPLVLTNFFSGTQKADLEVFDRASVEPEASDHDPVVHSTSTRPSILETVFEFTESRLTEQRASPSHNVDPEACSTATPKSINERSRMLRLLYSVKSKVLPNARTIPLDRLVQQVEYHFPQRADLPVQVYDFYPDRTEHLLTTVAHIEECRSQIIAREDC